MRFSFFMSNFSAWAPGIESDTDWLAWAGQYFTPECLNDKGKPIKPALKDVPAMQRRRFSLITRMAIECALKTTAHLPKGCYLPNVFASPQGEFPKTLSLLDSINLAEPLSPMGFGLSVHNTAAGLYSIHAGNQAPSSAIAAQQDTLLAAFTEAYLLSKAENMPVLLVYAEEPLPEDWAQYRPYDVFPHAFACWISHDALIQEGDGWRRLSVSTHNDGQSSKLSPSLDFLSWYFGGDEKGSFYGNTQRIDVAYDA